ncbi:hypothetical protein C8R44DRAFT_993032, partial [Mycena epipterygia]
ARSSTQPYLCRERNHACAGTVHHSGIVLRLHLCVLRGILLPFEPSSRPACLRSRLARCRWLAHPQESLTTPARHFRCTGHLGCACVLVNVGVSGWLDLTFASLFRCFSVLRCCVPVPPHPASHRPRLRCHWICLSECIPDIFSAPTSSTLISSYTRSTSTWSALASLLLPVPHSLRPSHSPTFQFAPTPRIHCWTHLPSSYPHRPPLSLLATCHCTPSL